MKKKIIFIVVIVLILCVGCTQDRMITQVKKDNGQILVGTGMRFYINSLIVKEESVNIYSNTIDIGLEISNEFPFANKYTLIILNNNEQEKYYVDEQAYVNYDIIIPKNSSKKIDLGLNNLYDGSNELIFILYREDDRIPKEEFVPSELYLTYKGITLFVNERNSIYSFKNTEPAHEIIEDYGEVPGIFLVKDKDSVGENGIKVLTQDQFKDANNYKFYIFRNISKAKFQQGILVVFIDNKQVEIYNNGNKRNNILSKLEIDKALIPVEIEIKEPGTHACFALLIGHSNETQPYSERLFFSNLLIINKGQ
ncbi:hypothetical protein [Desulfitobacterium hafniense]|uniref:hypothetical protein n=1 Tax=Desulfitobacterium hafniense TaxID=49338 RepID=UPI00037EE113|nr:hypothetical protein [Desulfitobacterium hafniense]